MMPAIYNVADIFIVTMMIGVALLVLVGLHLDGTREPRKTSTLTTKPTSAASGRRVRPPGCRVPADPDADAAAAATRRDADG